MSDVCLLLEGTYPFVAGGVSTWVHQLISSMEDIRFSLVCIAALPDPSRTMKYTLPSNIVDMKEIFLHDYEYESERKKGKKMKGYQVLQDFHAQLKRKSFDHLDALLPLFREKPPAIDDQEMFFSKDSWNMLSAFYEKYAKDVSFIDYFWSWRTTHLPLMNILKASLPPAKIYHTISTGYAGLLAALAKIETNGIVVLTEHGIYTHERMLEIVQAQWIYERQRKGFRAEKELSYFKQWWIKLFEFMSRQAYKHADHIFTLYEGNKTRQIVDGADPLKIDIIPNGINIDFYSSIPLKTDKSEIRIAFVGRVVPIKDVKTFILSAPGVIRKFQNAVFWIIGPQDEETEYYKECCQLIETLGLRENIIFKGRMKPEDIYSQVDLVVLTSVSEAQPYVIIEANCVGIPVVATDVGACRELIEGRTPNDRQLGPSGMVTEVASPDKTGEAIVEILEKPSLYERMSITGKKRVREFYNEKDLLSRYLNVYEKYL
ncbi:MAG: hypothetical protein A3I75_05545 [Deltaproteobacteria bacterium RIFCSPLOWO2_02_FULL_50_16]|nr:MAG: hypothetical protein A3B79_01625 [Deltaproteobacteria bacterium RIFCSPHIGHO2_02_FULL_50_15]OGQ58129.1 MAG: hypothetical protein A3I75_05545 [Deltaproteobacteria bacterium RIFCSPLOWO2_02_FULL_50_16]OGQ68099.1 MAG: hypothetical protein A3F89_01255 [Deltaproteobacteria bacterium RIFCSPLOWO2_12_FULL_50_11]